MRGITAGKELTIGYARFLGDPGLTMECQCRTAACRAVVKGTDWMRTDVQAMNNAEPDILAALLRTSVRSGGHTLARTNWSRRRGAGGGGRRLKNRQAARSRRTDSSTSMT